ncbi:21573_t:CDS:1, partial [Gigaspora rosea]
YNTSLNSISNFVLSDFHYENSKDALTGHMFYPFCLCEDDFKTLTTRKTKMSFSNLGIALSLSLVHRTKSYFDNSVLIAAQLLCSS